MSTMLLKAIITIGFMMKMVMLILKRIQVMLQVREVTIQEQN